MADLPGHPLIHRGVAGAQVSAGGPGDGRAGEKPAGFDVMAVTGVGGRIPQLGQDEQFGLMGLKRRQNGRQLERRALALGSPTIGSRTIGHVQAGKTSWFGTCTRLSWRGCLGGSHGLQPRQRHSGTHSAEKGPARQRSERHKAECTVRVQRTKAMLMQWLFRLAERG